jgi:hypothetical protein
MGSAARPKSCMQGRKSPGVYGARLILEICSVRESDDPACIGPRLFAARGCGRARTTLGNFLKTSFWPKLEAGGLGTLPGTALPRFRTMKCAATTLPRQDTRRASGWKVMENRPQAGFSAAPQRSMFGPHGKGRTLGRVHLLRITRAAGWTTGGFTGFVPCAIRVNGGADLSARARRGRDRHSGRPVAYARRSAPPRCCSALIPNIPDLVG